MKKNTAGGFDIIGDIHGHAGPLRRLLADWGYEMDRTGSYRHPTGRRVIFVGDYVDRGPEIVAVLRIVRAMAGSGSAVALMGNHEFNAIALDHRVGGKALRGEEKRKDHEETVRQLRAAGEDPTEWREWFKTLPLWHEERDFRVVHACWDNHHAAYLEDLRPDGRLQAADWDALADKRGALALATECLLKGKEAPLPVGRSFQDSDGKSRREARVAWWAQAIPRSWRKVCVGPWNGAGGDELFDESLMEGGAYPASEKPVFFGHYWMNGEPRWQAANACCLDYSVANGGRLVGYRFETERVTAGAFHSVPAFNSPA